MRRYVPHTEADKQALLQGAGVPSVEALLSDIPAGVRLSRPLNLPAGLPEADAMRLLASLAAANDTGRPLFRGAGCYHHYIPEAIGPLLSRGELLTAYTPYQPEMSQGMLQAIFEYQSLIARLTGLQVSNASVYDGATAAAEAMLMAREATRKNKLLASAALPPDVIAVLSTYAPCVGVELTVIPVDFSGTTDIEAVRLHAPGAAGLIAASPNYYGLIEDTAAQAEAVHAEKGLMIAYVNPIAMGILKKPGALGADIAVGEGQPLGIPMSFGGPGVGFMAATQKLLRNLPGRIVGETVDPDGNRAYVLTLQAREQHIRREKAVSNICSNQSLCALTAACYLALMGPGGLRDVAEQCLQNAHYLADGISKIPGMKLAFDGPFFHEFVVESALPAKKIDAALRDAGFTGGLPIDEHRILYCATEMNTKAEMDGLIKALEVIA